MDDELEGGGGGGGGGAPAWMATFGDMMSLLLCFFVLLLSFANMDVVKFREAMGSMRDAFGTTTINPGIHEARSTTVVEMTDFNEQEPAVISIESSEATDRKEAAMLNAIDELVAEHGLDGVVEAVPGDRGITVRVKGALMFQSASDGLKEEASPVLEQIVRLARENPQYAISVEGHTDDVPIRTPQFPSNWELSTSRAVAGVRYLIDTGGIDPNRLSASGHAHTQPLEKGRSARERASNRRLEFMFFRVEEGPPGDP